MPSLFNLVDRMADMVISTISPIRSPSPSPSRPHRKPHHREYESDYDYDYEGYNDEPRNNRFYSRRRSRQPTHTSFAVEGPQPEPLSPIDDPRTWKRSWHDKIVHWGGATEIPENVRKPTAPGLSEYPQRRNDLRRRDYVYAPGEYAPSPRASPSGSTTTKTPRFASPGAYPGSERSDSPDWESDSPASYEEQRYPEDWYAAPFPSRTPSPSAREWSSPTMTTKRQPLHHTHHPRKSILRRPTATDDEMLIRNLWAMVVLADNRLEYTYEFLSGVLLMGDNVIDTMMESGELMMAEEAKKHAERTAERQRQKQKQKIVREDSWPMDMPVPQSQERRERSPEHASGSSGRRFDRMEDIIEEEEEEC